MDEKALISIIVPVYKVEQFLHKCIDSIINQSYKNLEIILIDDGSPDNCGKICDEYAEKDYRINVIHQQNSGVSIARNNGIKIANGQYICFVDSDDYVMPDFIKNLAESIISYEADLCICDYYILKNNNKYPVNIYNHSRFLSKKEYYALVNSKSKICGYVWNKIFKKSIIIENNLLFKENLKLYQDLIFCINYIIYCKNVYYSSYLGCVYFQNINSAQHSMDKNPQKFIDSSVICFQEYAKLVQTNIDDIFKQNLLCRMITMAIDICYLNKHYKLHYDVKKYKKYVDANLWKWFKYNSNVISFLKYLLKYYTNSLFNFFKKIYKHNFKKGKV